MIYGLVSFIIVLALGIYYIYARNKAHNVERSKDKTSLRSLVKGQKARVVAIRDSNEALSRRMRELGLVPGTIVEMRGSAPLKDPIAIRLKGFTLSLRNSEADYIVIEHLEN